MTTGTTKLIPSLMGRFVGNTSQIKEIGLVRRKYIGVQLKTRGKLSSG